MKQQGYHNAFLQHEPGLIAIHTVPEFAIGQQALLLQTADGNYLWDCISYIDEATVQIIQALGGIKAIAISHPHYYSSMTEWAERFDAPILLHEADREWVLKDSPRIQFWSGSEYTLSDSVKLVNVGGHFPGSTVLHWRDGANGRGVLLTGDTVQVVADKRWVSFMYSYPNAIPLSAREIERIKATLERYEFDRLYGFTVDRVIACDAKRAVMQSADRYLKALNKE
jgi:glyoxylase-like metal-dependent hydrolase (beta-lactamase superfamily II)